uniref:NADH-ubiquinone oxidoreductase chain 4L n=1 Tax=Grandisonia sechellensis TaxID=441557 RepID=W5RGZ5_9AMPH|nr:NADH dehydrogenase subunit 4L [Grandisonia sechellensis]AGZ18963.1 NADH dehydrogenase subunit 4L [Grandisonia sechellensis]ANH55826.1 NADH dehydrogenase subunit 4L [Grandisonia sechellensis]
MTPMTFSIYAAFMISMTGLTFHRTHLLSALICLEGMMLSIFVSLAMWCLQAESMLFTLSPMALLTLSACGAGTGLAILVATTRTHGSDSMQNMNLLQC